MRTAWYGRCWTGTSQPSDFMSRWELPCPKSGSPADLTREQIPAVWELGVEILKSNLLHQGAEADGSVAKFRIVYSIHFVAMLLLIGLKVMHGVCKILYGIGNRSR